MLPAKPGPWRPQLGRASDRRARGATTTAARNFSDVSSARRSFSYDLTSVADYDVNSGPNTSSRCFRLPHAPNRGGPSRRSNRSTPPRSPCCFSRNRVMWISRSFAVVEHEISESPVVVAGGGDGSESGKPGMRVWMHGARTPGVRRLRGRAAADQKGKVSTAMSSSSPARHAA